MKTVVQWDKTEIVVTDDQARALKAAIERGVDHVEIGERWLRCAAIACINPGGVPSREAVNRQLPDRTPLSSLSDEELARRRQKLAAIRQTYLLRRAAHAVTS